MPRVLPSQVVAAIPDLFPGVEPKGNQATLRKDHEPQLRTLLSLLDRIPDELLVMEPNIYVQMMRAISSIQTALGYWAGNSHQSSVSHIGPEQKCAVWVISDALLLCKDEAVPPSTVELQFITDSKMRETFRLDIGAAERALSNGEWKAATILAGSMIEALLHWRLSEPQMLSKELKDKVSAAVQSKNNLRNLNEDLNRWNLAQFNAIAAEFEIIQSNTEKFISLVKEYRNLIHAGAVARTAQVCDRATAHAAMSGLYHVIRDLSP